MDVLDIYRKDRVIFADKLQSLDCINGGITEPLKAKFSEKSIQLRFDEDECDTIAMARAISSAFAAYSAADIQAVVSLAESFKTQARFYATRIRDRRRFYATFYNTVNRRKRLKR